MEKIKNPCVVNDANEDKNNRLSELPCNYSLIDIDELTLLVSEVAKECFYSLDFGLPVSVHQLKLFNVLTKRGLKLKSEKSSLSADNENNNSITVNDILIITYLTEMDNHYQIENETKNYLDKKNYVVGLLINITNNDIDITKIDRYSITH